MLRPPHRGRRVRPQDLADDEPVAEHADRSQVLLHRGDRHYLQRMARSVERLGWLRWSAVLLPGPAVLDGTRPTTAPTPGSSSPPPTARRAAKRGPVRGDRQTPAAVVCGATAASRAIRTHRDGHRFDGPSLPHRAECPRRFR